MSTTVSSSFLECQPTATTGLATKTVTYTTTYCVTLPAACPTSEWLATYTVVEVCTGNPATYTPPAVPPNFVVTTVTCEPCAEKTQVITAPPATPTGPATVIGGNGVTVTVAPQPPASAQPTGPAAEPTGPVVVAGAPPSLKKSLVVLAGIAAAAGQFLLM
ncbi:hypothetical protein VTK73DRAFT_3833 [Phialemonium thermophilum]|uniref:Uncharacterized protein n=1 Tax=Phialemonium thermophilum TaxID=223376 RepID=A0ABR3WWW7_9PEZI